jgi:hypothetical protein
LKINDMNAVAFREDVRLHTRIPLVGAMSKVDATLKQGFHGNNSHGSPCFRSPNAQESGVERSEFSGINGPLKDA